MRLHLRGIGLRDGRRQRAGLGGGGLGQLQRERGRAARRAELGAALADRSSDVLPSSDGADAPGARRLAVDARRARSRRCADAVGGAITPTSWKRSLSGCCGGVRRRWARRRRRTGAPSAHWPRPPAAPAPRGHGPRGGEDLHAPESGACRHQGPDEKASPAGTHARIMIQDLLAIGPSESFHESSPHRTARFARLHAARTDGRDRHHRRAGGADRARRCWSASARPRSPPRRPTSAT